MRALGLEFAAVDYAMRADGTVVVWEVNAHFGLPPALGNGLVKERRMGERHGRLFAGVRACFERLLEGAGADAAVVPAIARRESHRPAGAA